MAYILAYMCVCVCVCDMRYDMKSLRTGLSYHFTWSKPSCGATGAQPFPVSPTENTHEPKDIVIQETSTRSN